MKIQKSVPLSSLLLFSISSLYTTNSSCPIGKQICESTCQVSVAKVCDQSKKALKQGVNQIKNVVTELVPEIKGVKQEAKAQAAKHKLDAAHEEIRKNKNRI
jgi:hypothetical protein